MPIAQPDCVGRLVTSESLDEASSLVREIMIQDRDLSAWVARKALVQFKAVADGWMSGDFGHAFEAGYAAMGLHAATGGGNVRILDGRDESTQEQREGAGAMGALAINLLLAITSDPARRDHAAWRIYENLYTGADGTDVETLAYEIVAWVSVLLARLSNAGSLVGEVPFLNSQYRVVPIMAQAGWYPNPPNVGPIVMGDATFQRYWDGTWTDRVRARSARGDWELLSMSLHGRPDD